MIAARGKKKKSKGGKESSSEIDEGDGEEDEHGEEEHGLDEDAVEGHDQEGEKKVGQKEGKEDMDIEGADGLKGTDSKGDTGDEMCVAGVEGTKEIEQVCALSEAGFVCGKEDKEDDAGMQRWSQSEKETAGVAEQDSVKDQACRAAEIVSANETVHGPAESSPREDSASYDEDDPDEYLSQKDAEAQRRRIIVPSTVEGPGLEYDEEAPEAYLARKDAQTAHRRSVDVCIEEGINALSLVGEDGKGGDPEDDKRAEDRQGEVLSVRQEGALKGKDADSVIENGEGIGEKEEEAMGLEDDMEDVWKGKQSREGDMSLGMARVLAEEMHICGLKMCFSELLRVELLDGDNMFACEGCGKDALRRKGDKSLPEDGGKPGKVPMVRTPATKQSLLWDAPSILVCNIKRFTMTERGKLRKVDTHVSFPVELDVGAFFHREAPKENVEVSTYNLYGVVVHSGTLHSGHYIAYVCDSTDGGERVWRYFSDAQVKV